MGWGRISGSGQGQGLGAAAMGAGPRDTADQWPAWLAWACCQAALKLSSWASIV